MNVHYAFPEAAYFLALVLMWGAFFWLLMLHRRNKISLLGQPKIQQRVMIPRSPLLFWGKVSALCVAWVLLTVALMQPAGYGEYPKDLTTQRPITGLERQRRPHAIILAVDASASMTVPDMPSGKTRLDAAKEIADQLVSKLTGQSVALDAFTSEVTPLSPLTTDYLFVRLMLRQLAINEGGNSGTDLLNALKQVQERHFPEPVKIPTSVVLLTDGGDTELEALQGVARDRRMAEIVGLVRHETKGPLRFYSVGLGSIQGASIPGITDAGKPVLSALNESLLKSISEAGRGKYYAAHNYSSIDLAGELASTLESEGLSKMGDSNASHDNPIQTRYYQIPLGLAICLLAAVLILPDTVKKKLVLMIILMSCCLQPIYGDVMQQASAYAATQEYAQARELYQQLLQGTLEPWERAVVLFDMGTVWLQERNWDQAIATLKIVPFADYPTPLLSYRGKHNLILAYMGKASSVKSGKEANENLQAALNLIPELQRSYCALRMAQGMAECNPEEALSFLKTYIEQQLATVLQQREVVGIESASFKEGASLLLQGIQDAVSHAKFLQFKELSEELRQRYRDLFLKEDQELLPLWQKLPQKIVQKDPYRSQRLKLLDTARSQFLQGISQMKSGDDEESQKVLESAVDSVKALLALPPPPAESNQPPPSEELREQQPQEKPVEQSVQLLLEMERDDTMPKESPVPKPNPRPW